MISLYPGIIEKEPTSDYGVYFPDLPGCISAGKTLNQAILMGQEALKLYTDFLIEKGKTLPPPTAKENVTWPDDEMVVRVEMFAVTVPDRVDYILA
ncbi:MAG: type II toxin-antitoxin system HicB family antitoxin [Candidatus Symbiobacter sp.]|nr:type II toxin-antitoxin system HicB family antitoxin [Candidatus Symbiobacter sp.]